MSQLQLMAAEAALKKMLSDKHFSICTMDKIVDMLGIKPDKEAYDILSTLHCIDYSAMRRELLEALPDLIHRVLRSPSFDASRINIVESGSVLKLVRH